MNYFDKPYGELLKVKITSVPYATTDWASMGTSNEARKAGQIKLKIGEE